MSTKPLEKIVCEGVVDNTIGEHTIKSPEEFQKMTFKEDAMSPINISYGNACKVILPDLSWENWDKKPLKMELINTGHTVLLVGVWRKRKPMISGGPLTSKYKFLQLHFHWGNKDEEGSYHTFDNEALPLEMHAMFLNECYKTQEEALEHSDGMIVLVYVYKVHDSGNQSIEVISQLCPLVQQSGNSVFCPPMEIGSLLYPFSHDYFVYRGSMKMHNKGHAMLWLLCSQSFAVTSEQLWRLRSIMNKDAKNSGDHCRVELPNNRGNDLFLANPTSSLQTTLYEVDPRIKWENIKTEVGTGKDGNVHKKKNEVEKGRARGSDSGDDDQENNLSDQFNLNLVAKAVRAVKSLMGKSVDDEFVKACSKSLNDISDSLTPIDDHRESSDRDKSVPRTTLGRTASLVTRAKSTVQCSSPGNVAECAQTAADACEYQAEQSDRRQEGGLETNCLRVASRIQFAVDQEDNVSEDNLIEHSEHSEPGASSEPESEVPAVCTEPGLLSTKDSVQYLRQNYKIKCQTTDVNNNSTTSSPTQRTTGKAVQQPGKLGSKIKYNLHTTQKKTLNNNQRSRIPLQIKTCKPILKNSITPPILNKEENSPSNTRRMEQRSLTAPGLFVGNGKGPISPSNCRPTTARKRTEPEEQSAVERPVTSKEPHRPRPISKTNIDIKPRWKF